MYTGTKVKRQALNALLVIGARNGDRQAVSDLVQLHTARMQSHAMRLLGDAEGARDCVQDAWVDIIRGLKGLRDENVFLPWALRIVTRRVAREISNRQRRRALDSQLVAETVAVGFCDGFVSGPDAADAAVVRRALLQLSPDQRACVALFYLEDMRVAEVAVALDVPVGTIKTRLMHARQKLRAILEGESNG
jgi:RNA polymerase sigma-70 factor (ECF subfamily)